jgi:hypothetical protein
MTEDTMLFRRRIVARLRKTDSVQTALQRLASQNKVTIADVKTLALAITASIDSRRDAITALFSMEDGTENVLHDLLDSSDRVIVIKHSR